MENLNHICFIAPTQEAVHAFYEAALAVGATDKGAPRAKPDYGEPYYECFVRDRDEHQIEASYWDIQLVHALYIDTPE